MRRSVLATVPVLVLLAACGGSSGDMAGPAMQNVVPATTVAVGFPAQPVPQWQPATYVSGQDQLIVYPRGVLSGGTLPSSVALVRNTTPERAMPNFFRAFASGSQRQAVRGVTPSGSGVAYAARLFNQGIERGVERIGDTTLPSSGRGVYNGTYAGVLGDVTNSLEDAGLITGSAQMIAEFDAGTISGSVFGRRNGSGRDFASVQLPESVISTMDGSFAGATSGGLLTGLNYTGAQGSFNGLIVGDSGQEIVGGLNITHSLTGSPTLIEQGVFVVVQQ